MDFVDQIGSEAYLSVNIGSGTPQEAAEWLEYLTTDQPTALAKERAANGHPAPYKIPYLGLGNESWDCGGNMTPEYYTRQMTIYSRFVRNFNPAQRDTGKMLRIAVGPGGGEPRWTDWTETVMKAWQGHQWSWDMEGLSLHNYTVIKWPPAYASVGFGEKEYAEILQKTLETDGLIAKHSAIMDKYDPQKKIALVVDEWGAWYAKLPGSPEGFLVQQNSQRDAVLAALNLNIFARHADRVRMANIAQMVNVLQAMILTDKEKMVLTPTYHVFKMYVPFQDATFVPVTFDAGTYTQGDITLPRVDAIAAKDAAGKLWMAVTNVDPNRPATITASVAGLTPRSAAGQTLTAPRVDSVNTFEAPTTVAPKPIAAKVQGGTVTLTVEPKSVTVIARPTVTGLPERTTRPSRGRCSSGARRALRPRHRRRGRRCRPKCLRSSPAQGPPPWSGSRSTERPWKATSRATPSIATPSCSCPRATRRRSRGAIRSSTPCTATPSAPSSGPRRYTCRRPSKAPSRRAPRR